MAITRAQQFRQMLEDGGMLVQPGFGGTRQGYRGKGADDPRQYGDTAEAREEYKASRDDSSFPTDNDQDADAITMAQAMEDQDFKGRRVVDGKTDLRTRPDKLADLKEKLRKFKATRRKVTIPGFGLSKGLEGIAQAFSDFGAKFNRPFFERVIAAERIPGLDLSTIMNMTEEEIEDAYDSYMKDRLAGKTDAMGNLKAGFMRDASGNIISTGNDGREDPIIPAMAKAMEEDTEEEYVNPLSLLTPRIAGSRFLGSEFAADGGRIGYQRGGRRGDYGQASYTESPSFSRPDDDSPQQTTTKKPVRTFGDDSDAMRFDKRQLASFGIFGDPKKRQQFAEVLKMKKIIEGSGLEEPETATDATQLGTGDILTSVPDLTNPDVINKIAIDAGLPTQKEGIKFINEKNVATPGAASAIKSIQGLKRFKDPDTGENLGFPVEEVIELKPGNLTEEQIRSVYDMVQADQLPRTLAAEGGIMDLGRQELFLGGIAKGLKKAARGVSRTLKKVAKSPIGKAALFAGLAGIPFGAGSAGTGFFGPKSLFGRGMGFLSTMKANKALQAAGSSDYFGGATGILDFFKKNPLLAIAGTSVLAGAMTPKEEDGEDEFLRQYYSMRLDPSQSVRGMGSQFDFYNTQFAADGGRIGYQEGSKEPVAKKTMPLLNMDGQEMDLRDNGGFVPIGRMEKADDVPARLSKNEFVFTADAVRNAGDGDVDKGAEVMYNMMKNLERGGNVSDESQGLEGAREMFQTSKRLEEVL
jgi:hypothetical protein